MDLLLMSPRGWRTMPVSLMTISRNVLADMSRLAFRDPDHFLAGELHRHVACRLFSDIGSNSGELHGNQSSKNLCIRFSLHFLIILRLVVNF